MITCPNCGAQINEDSKKCIYCGYINIEGAKKKHQEQIEEIKEDIEELKKEPEKALKKGMSKSLKVIVKTIVALLIVAIIYAVMLHFALQNHPKMNLSPEEQAYASAYKADAMEKLKEAYDNNDIELMAKIFDKAYSEDRVSLWGDPHYETAYASSCYMKLKECLPNLDKNKLKTREAEEITYYCFYFYYRAYGDDGAPIFDSIRENEIVPIVTTRLGFTHEDMEGFRGEITESGHVVRSTMHIKIKKYYKNYR